MAYEDKAEVTREFYRKQGEQRKTAELIAQIERLAQHNPGKTWAISELTTILKATN